MNHTPVVEIEVPDWARFSHWIGSVFMIAWQKKHEISMWFNFRFLCDPLSSHRNGIWSPHLVSWTITLSSKGSTHSFGTNFMRCVTARINWNAVFVAFRHICLQWHIRWARICALTTPETVQAFKYIIKRHVCHILSFHRLFGLLTFYVSLTAVCKIWEHPIQPLQGRWNLAVWP